MELWDALLDGSFMPHGHCLLWRWDLLFLHVGGDALTSLSYFAIPPAMLIFRRKRKDLSFDKLMLMYAGFIFLCGVSHVYGLINIWNGFYAMEGIVKLATGLISAATAAMVWYLLPRFLAIPSKETITTNLEILKQSRYEIREARLELEFLEQKIAQRMQLIDKLDGDGSPS